MPIFWCFVAVAAVLLFIKLYSVWSLRKPRSEKWYEYVDANSGERQAQEHENSAYEGIEAESRNAQEMAEQNTSLWL